MSLEPIAAFFDFDKTILDGDSQGLEINYYALKGDIGRVRLYQLSFFNALYERGLLPAITMVRKCIETFSGWQHQNLQEQTDDFFNTEVRPRLRPHILDLVREHQEQGHHIVLVSASVRHIINRAADEIGADHVFSTELEANREGNLTGRSAGPICIGKQKRYRAEQLAARHSINLDESYAYTDHHADLPLLEAVGHPIAVDPTPKLARIAQRRKWPIISCGTSKEGAGYALDFGWHSKRE